MSLTYGFFNAKNSDRTYNAEQMSSLFAGIIQDGVFKDYPASGNQLKVTASSEALKVNVGPGRAWFKNIWVDNDGIVTLTVSRPATAAKRSAVVLEIRKNDTGDKPRQARLIIVDGNGTTLPTMVRDDTSRIYQYMLAYLDVPASSDTSWNGVFDASKIHNRVGVSGGIPYAVVPVDSVINNRITSELANYLNDDGSALYQFLSGKFDAVNAIISNLTGSFKKLFFFQERPYSDSENYYGMLSEKYGKSATIRSKDETNGGMTSSFRPGQATVVQGDVVISSTGKIGHITGVTRNPTTNKLQTVTIMTVGNIWNDHHYTTSLVYYIEREESESANYYGQLSGTFLGTSVIRSKDSVSGGMPAAWWPSSHHIEVGDAVISSGGKVGSVTEVVRSNSTGQLLSVTVKTQSNFISSIIARVAALESTSSYLEAQVEDNYNYFYNIIEQNSKDLVYYSECEESENLGYYGTLSDTHLGTATIVSRDSAAGGMPSAWWPASHTIKVGDAVLGSRGNMGRITEVVRSESTNQLISVTIETRSKLLNDFRTRLSSAETTIQDHATRVGNLEDWYTEMDGLGIGARLTALETWKLRAVPAFIVHLHIDPELGNNKYTTVESFATIQDAYLNGRAIVIRLDPAGDSRIPETGHGFTEAYDISNIHAVCDGNTLQLIRGTYLDEDRRGTSDTADWYWLQIYALIEARIPSPGVLTCSVQVFVDRVRGGSSTNTIRGLEE